MANKSLGELKHYGERRNFTLESYYDMISKNFNMLELVGVAHALIEEQKIIKFEAGLKEEKAISYSINSKSTWDSLPDNDQTFDSYYNTFSSFMNKHNTLVQGNQRKIQISQAITEKHQSSRKRVRQFRQNHPVRRGRGRGRGGMRSRTYNPNSMARNFRHNFKAEGKLNSKDEYNSLTPSHKSQIHELKLSNGWVDGCTPPPGFPINYQTGKAEPSVQTVFAIRAATSNTSYDNNTHNQSRVEFAPLPHVIDESTSRALGESNRTPLGTSFGRSWRRQPPSSNSTISSVTLNGRSYHGPVFDNKGNKLN